jgi:spore germination cell wall hydrolase CwlJ-like protein
MVITKKEAKENEIKCLALCIYQEARGEPTIGKRWVGSVVINRVNHKTFPNSIYDVVFQKYQFSWTVSGGDSFTIKEEIAWKECVEIATDLLSKKSADTNSLYFLSGTVSPKWVENVTFVKKIGGHRFYC